mmetsp:Transcript_97706/g.193442  ORF Transcript_97706/g.193442 Transcript_97706/m.193442 type:complete len:531 (-) Transcript_97706:305-1897(-)
MVMLDTFFFMAALLLRPSRSARVEGSERSGRCWDTNHGLVDDKGWDCEVYYQTEGMCGLHDGNSGFNSKEMCCACNGGYWDEADMNQEHHERQDPCQGLTCDQWIAMNPAYTCSYLTDAFGCDCSTSSCLTSCPATCDGFRCDDWIDSNHAYSCGLLQHSYGCECSGCECKTHVAALIDGYSLLTNKETQKSGDCMQHCVGCDHTWLTHRVSSIQGCRALCDENFNEEGIEKWCFAYSWDEDWSACRLYHEVPDGPSSDRMVCYVKEQIHPAEHSAYDSNLNLIADEGITHQTSIQKDTPMAILPLAKNTEPQPTQKLGLVFPELWAHYMMQASLTFKLTNTFSDPSACAQSPEACISNVVDHSLVLTMTKTGGAYSRRTVVFRRGFSGPSENYAVFKPNAMNLHTTWRVADINDDNIIYFSIQKIKGGVDCKTMGFNCKKAWTVYRGLTRDNIVVYYAIEVVNQFKIYKDRAAFEADATDWRATVASILPTKQNGESVLSITVKPGEDTALLMLAGWAMHKSGDTKEVA